LNFTIAKRQFFVKRKEMKKFFCTTILTVLMASAAIAGRQDYPEEYLGLPGDNLNLYAVMNLFQESETLEAFERSLNEENSRINNLDLNNDGYVDYLTVSDFVSGNVHTIVLRSVLDRNEYQDVAVFTVEQLRNGEVQIQLIGDEALYGRNYIVEPNYAETPNPGYTGRTVQRNNVTVVTTTYYEVAAWPVIRYIYSPRYVIWRSNWYWGYYPVYWHPWRPFFWHHYYGYHYHWYPHYYAHYRHWHQPRWNHYHDYYYGSVRAYSPNVSHRITAGSYKQTYSRPETRRDGEALYASTAGTRSRSVGSQATAGRRQSETAAAAQDQSRTRSVGTTAGRRQSETAAAAQGSETRRSATTQPATRTQSSSSGRNSAPATRTQSSTSRSSSAPAARTQSSTSRSSSAPAARTQSSTSGRSSAPAARSQSSSSGRSSAPAARTQSSSRSSSVPAARTQSSSRSSSTPAARTQSNSSGRSSGTVSSRSSKSSSRSSGTPSKSSSRSSSSSGKSDNSSRSSRR